MNIAQIEYKLALSVRTAREASRASWQFPQHRSEYKRISVEALQDAAGWRALLAIAKKEAEQ